MLAQLHIENYAIIDRIVVDFGPGLNVLTGETGAGKSMIVGALGLILGQRAHTEVVRTDDKPTLVEALFDISAYPQLLELLATLGIETDEPYLLLKRLVTRNSSRCYVNANLATLTMLQEIGQHLVDLLSQHQHQTLLRREQQLALLDAYGKLGDDSAALRLAYQRYHALTKEIQTLQHADQHRVQRLDLLRFQAEEIDKARLHNDEEEQLTAEQHLLLNAEKLYELSQDAYALLYRNEHAILETLAEVRDKLEQLATLDTRQGALPAEIQDSYYALEEIAQRLREYNDRQEVDPTRLQAIEDRLAEIGRLKRKYGATIADILRYRQTISHEHLALTRHEEHLEDITAELGKLRQTLKSRAVTLSDKRRQTAERLQRAIRQELHDLNMPHTVFQIVCALRHHPEGDIVVGTERVALTAEGIDEIEYLFSPNPGQPLKPLSRIASGGELSRVMLALKSVLVREDRTPTLILDEVDAGIGGRTSKIVGEKLRHIASAHQVLCITHLPQIASHGDQHYRVEKSVTGDNTTIEVQTLSFSERVEEIARMSGGKQITATTRKHAEEMLTRRP
jgi:DNA repair protein RecN (Recombination protein N)